MGFVGFEMCDGRRWPFKAVHVAEMRSKVAGYQSIE